MCKITITRYRRCDCIFATVREKLDRCDGYCQSTVENTTYLRDAGNSLCEDNHRLFNDQGQPGPSSEQNQAASASGNSRDIHRVGAPPPSP
ncbi:hypothetical protein PG987_007464 [Apiospora arundinis]